MNARTQQETIGQVFRDSGKTANIVRVAGVSVIYKAGEKLELSKRDDYPSDGFVLNVCAVAREYGVVIEPSDGEESEDNTHGVRWCKVVWLLRSVKLDDVIDGVTDSRPAEDLRDTHEAMTWDAARVKAANAKGTAAHAGKRAMAGAPRMF